MVIVKQFNKLKENGIFKFRNISKFIIKKQKYANLRQDLDRQDLHSADDDRRPVGERPHEGRMAVLGQRRLHDPDRRGPVTGGLFSCHPGFAPAGMTLRDGLRDWRQLCADRRKTEVSAREKPSCSNRR